MFRSLLLALTLTGVVAHAQIPRLPNMYKVCSEQCYITAAPPTTVLQFGAGANWQAPFPFSNFPSPLYVSNTILGDPFPGTLKEIDAQERIAPYDISYQTAQGGPIVTVTIPAAPQVCLTPPTVTVDAAGTLRIVVPAYCTLIQPNGAYAYVTGLVGYNVSITGNPALPLFAPGTGTNVPTQ